MMFAENRKISIRQLQMLLLLDCFGTAVLFLPAELAEISGERVLFWRLCLAVLGGVGCFPSADGSRKAHAQWHGGRLVPERLRQWYRDNPFAWLGRKAFA